VGFRGFFSGFKNETRVCVRQHDGKDDEVGVECPAHAVSAALREYEVCAGQLIKVTIWNWSSHQIQYTPVYIATGGKPDPERHHDLKADGDKLELPYPLQMSPGEAPDAWYLLDSYDNEVLRLRFSLSAARA
jgi:hypothetical protein